MSHQASHTQENRSGCDPINAVPVLDTPKNIIFDGSRKTAISHALDRFAAAVKGFSCFLGLLILLTGCGPVYIPVYAPDPFSSALMDYIESGLTRRADIVRWLGKPTTTRMDGKLMIYVGPREIQRELFTHHPMVSLHYLILELGSNDVVIRYDEIVDEGCTSWDVCIADAWLRDGWHTGMDLPSIAALVAERLVLLADPDMDSEAKRFRIHPDQCSIFMYRVDKGDRPLFIRSEPGRALQSLSKDTYFLWTLSPDPKSVMILSKSGSGNTADEQVDITCEAGALSFLGFGVEASGFLTTRHRTITYPETAPQGMEHVRSKRLIMN